MEENLPYSETTEPEHEHACWAGGHYWSHFDCECKNIGFDPATCPDHDH